MLARDPNLRRSGWDGAGGAEARRRTARHARRDVPVPPHALTLKVRAGKARTDAAIVARERLKKGANNDNICTTSESVTQEPSTKRDACQRSRSTRGIGKLALFSATELGLLFVTILYQPVLISGSLGRKPEPEEPQASTNQSCKFAASGSAT